ncbi:MAG: FKBP-type peptidyl-prolyl cis-trans isomerase [Bacteroidota bacterium]
MKNLWLLLPAFALLLVFSCSDEDYCIEQNKVDEALINRYIDSVGLTGVQVTEDGIHYVITQEGDGPAPTSTSRVTVHYIGTKLDGTKFDSSYDRGQSTSFSLTGVIEGWQLGIPLLRKGGSGILIIPSCLAYRRNPPSSTIGRDAVLVFDIRLLEVN